MTLETEFADVLDVIATNLGIAAERIFGIFVGGQAMSGILDIGCVICSVVVAYFAWWYTRKITVAGGKDADGGWKSDDAEVTHWIAPIIAAVFAFFITWMLTETIDGSILKILCPEYTAMREIISLVR